MRRLSMKSKRRKSDTNTTDSESEENGVARNNEGNNGDLSLKGDDNEAESTSQEKAVTPTSTTTAAPTTTTPTTATTTTTPSRPKPTARKRGSRSRYGKSHPVEADKSTEDGDESASQPDEQENESPKSGARKRRKKDDQKASTSGQIKNEQEYEVEKLVGHRTIKGRRQFLVRWKGYDEDSDTWENEKDLNCPQLMEEFLAEEEENNVEPEKPTKAAKTKISKSEKKSKKSRSNAKKVNDVDQKDTDSQKEFEVEKIIDVYFKKNKTREFLIRWKGFTSADDTWEPEENLNCPDLINKFMQKVEKAKTAEMRELRTNPAHTKRYTLATHEHGRRLSRRNMDKQRATYHECDE